LEAVTQRRVHHCGIRPLTSVQTLRLPSLYRAAATFLRLCNQPATVYDP